MEEQAATVARFAIELLDAERSQRVREEALLHMESVLLDAERSQRVREEALLHMESVQAATMTQRMEMATQLEAAVATRETSVAQREASVAQREASLEQCEMAAMQREACVAQLETTAAKRNEAHTERETALARRKATLSTRDDAAAADAETADWDSDEEYPVERIMGERVLRNGLRQYEVRWVGWATTTWEPASNLVDTAALDAWERHR